ncbi:MAG: hypothetical protein HDT40_09060 [Lachnospiraceae bacterium]|nr:hypothetical protein [Lachnospiraceae bacterium]
MVIAEGVSKGSGDTGEGKNIRWDDEKGRTKSLVTRTMSLVTSRKM